MNERDITTFLKKQITKERVNSLTQMINASLPGVGVIAGILGGLVMRAIGAAKDYINRIDQMPIVPPDIESHMTYEQAVSFFNEKKLNDMFEEILTPAADMNNPNINHDRVIVGRASAVVKKCFDHDDKLFNVFYHKQIEQGEYFTVWSTYGDFLKFKAKLRAMLPPAEFVTMFETIIQAVAEEGLQQIKNSASFKKVKELLQEHINKIVPGDLVDLDKIIDQLGDIS